MTTGVSGGGGGMAFAMASFAAAIDAREIARILRSSGDIQPSGGEVLALVERQALLRIHHGLGVDRLLRDGGSGGQQQDGENGSGAPHSSTHTAAKNPTIIL
jgi:hypothetical protein